MVAELGIPIRLILNYTDRTMLGGNQIMTLATDRKITLNEFLTYDDGSDRCYELVDGVLVEMATESTINLQIAIFLIELFLQLTGR